MSDKVENQIKKGIDRSNNLTLKYQKYTQSGCKDTGINEFNIQWIPDIGIHRLS